MFQPIRMCHVMVSTYSRNVPWSRDESRLSIHIMWSIPQSRDVESRKLKTIKYSVHDMWPLAECISSILVRTPSPQLGVLQILQGSFYLGPILLPYPVCSYLWWKLEWRYTSPPLFTTQTKSGIREWTPLHLACGLEADCFCTVPLADTVVPEGCVLIVVEYHVHVSAPVAWWTLTIGQ